MSPVRLACCESGACFEISDCSGDPGEPSQEFTATLTGEGLRAEAHVCDTPWYWLAHFFRELAQEWKGWPGNKEWRGDGLHLDVTHDGSGHALFEVTLEQCTRWNTSVHLSVELGALERLAQNVEGLFGIPNNAERQDR